MPRPLTPTPTAAHTLARLRAGELQGSTHLDLRGAGLSELPAEVLRLADTLEVLDLSGNGIATLPAGMANLSRLHTLFASGNRFTTVPTVLGRLPVLDTLGLKANHIAEVEASALAPTLRWLILTDNLVTALPASLTECHRMQKLMLAGNRLGRLPRGMGRLQRLELIRLSANCFEAAEHALPDDLLALPQLAWLAHAGNPFSAAREQAANAWAGARSIDWSELDLQAVLGEGASGHIHAARWQPSGGLSQDVAVKLFKGAVTSDGLPRCEMAATLMAGDHPGLVGVRGVLVGHPRDAQGLVLPRLAPHWAPLARPPSMASCTRDVYADGLRISAAHAEAVARSAAEALGHLHARGLMHGDLYAHNLLVDGQGGALLSDFGAASFLPADDRVRIEALKALDSRALQILVKELSQRSDVPAGARLT
ncbi:leucine-rich repeat-containing protein kinase family protein [soil metagenome]